MAVGISGIRQASTLADNTNHTALLPNGNNVLGRRIIVVASFDGNPTVTWPATGWSVVGTGTQTGTTDGHYEIRYHDYDGTEGWDGTDDPVALTTSVAEEAAFVTYAVTGYDPAQAPEAASPSVAGLTLNPNPPNLTPSWGSAEDLWIAVACLESGSDFSAAPTNYTDLQSLNTAGTGSTGLGTATRVLTATSEDPGTFTIANTRRNVTTTVAVKALTAVNLVVNDSTHDQQADGVALTQVHQLVTADSTHGQQADSTTLTQVHQLVVADATHSETADEPSLTQAHELVVVDATHDQQSESPNLTQAHELQVDDATHQQTSDSITITTEALTLMGRIYAGASLLLDCVCEALADRCPDRVCVAPGAVASIENCCAGSTGGQLNINVARMYPSRDFPTPLVGVNNCDAPFTVVEYLIQIARCAPVGNAQHPPSCAKLDASAQDMMDDLETIFTGVSCCLKTSDLLIDLAGQKFPYIIGDVESIGPEGGCAGAVVSLFVGFNSCLGC